MPVSKEIEVCPSCGDLAELTPAGWCYACSRGICIECGKPTDSGKYCTEHRRIAWLSRNADKIENYIAQGFSPAASIKLVIDDNRPICIICAAVIKHGTNGRHFICNNTTECKKARRRYKYLVYDKGFSKQAALQQVLIAQEAA